jgi:hypothetical protein
MKKMTKVQEFDCIEPIVPKCDQKVYYERDPIPALSKMATTGRKVVYLTCAKGHTNQYEVEE